MKDTQLLTPSDKRIKKIIADRAKLKKLSKSRWKVSGWSDKEIEK